MASLVKQAVVEFKPCAAWGPCNKGRTTRDMYMACSLQNLPEVALLPALPDLISEGTGLGACRRSSAASVKLNAQTWPQLSEGMWLWVLSPARPMQDEQAQMNKGLPARK